MKLTIKWEKPILCFFSDCSILSRWRQEKRSGPFKLSHSLLFFTALTPPASDVLAKYYIKQAITLNPLPQYLKEAAFIENGN